MNEWVDAEKAKTPSSAYKIVIINKMLLQLGDFTYAAESTTTYCVQIGQIAPIHRCLAMYSLNSLIFSLDKQQRLASH